MLHTFKYPQSIITPFVSFLEAQRPVNESDDLSTKWKSQGFQEKIQGRLVITLYTFWSL